MRVKLTVKCKLDVPQSSVDAIDDTFSRYRDACQYISGVAFETRTFSRVKLHHATYYPTRERTDLPAQLTCTAIAKAAEAYKRDKTRRHRFKRDAIRLDARTFRLYTESETCTFTTAHGRVKGALLIGDYQRQLLSTWEHTGAADLVKQRGVLYMHIVVYRDFDEPETASEYLGADLGIRNIATTSDGDVMTGEVVDKVRTRYAKLRQRLQAKGTRSAKRHLKKLAKRERRMKRDANHAISKRLVAKAAETNRGIAVEDLQGIRERTGKRLRKSQRSRHMKWAFGELRAFIEYKARLAGVATAVVDPAYTSQTCSECGHCERTNRRSQSEFACKGCGYVAAADQNAAVNIGRAAVMQPTAAGASLQAASPLL